MHREGGHDEGNDRQQPRNEPEKPVAAIIVERRLSLLLGAVVGRLTSSPAHGIRGKPGGC